ncbi:MAG: hypothetical protein M1833_003578, partial [Piccolia ochrophora]
KSLVNGAYDHAVANDPVSRCRERRLALAECLLRLESGVSGDDDSPAAQANVEKRESERLANPDPSGVERLGGLRG